MYDNLCFSPNAAIIMDSRLMKEMGGRIIDLLTNLYNHTSLKYHKTERMPHKQTARPVSLLLWPKTNTTLFVLDVFVTESEKNNRKF